MQKDPFDALRFKAYLAASDNDSTAAEQFFEKANAIKLPCSRDSFFAWTQMLFSHQSVRKRRKAVVGADPEGQEFLAHL